MKKRSALRCTETSGKQKVGEGEEERKTPDMKASGDVFKMKSSVGECSYRARVPHISFPLDSSLRVFILVVVVVIRFLGGWMDGWCRERRLSFSVVLIDLLLLLLLLQRSSSHCGVKGARVSS